MSGEKFTIQENTLNKNGIHEAGIDEIAYQNLLDKLCMDLTAAYYVELNSAKFEVVHLLNTSNADGLLSQKEYTDFDEFARKYAFVFLAEDKRKEFLDWITCSNLKKAMEKSERVTYHFETIPNGKGNKYFESQAIKIHEEKNSFYVLIGFRYIDDIMKKELAVQRQLQKALDELKLNNEIISAISKNYSSIFRIDIKKDYFEEISSDDEVHKLTGNKGCASEKLYKICDTLVAPEYRFMLHEFLNIKTVPQRLENEESVVTEYRMCDGNWHRLRFIAKKRNAAGEVTHVLCTVRSSTDAKRRELDLCYEAEAAKREADLKAKFLANMSHDIRTPLNGLMGMVNLGDQYADDLVMQQKIREKSKESLGFLVSLVNDVLDMSKLESGNLEKHEITFDILPLIQSANVQAHIRANDRNISYIVDWDNTDIKHPFLIGNPVYVTRIFSKIVDNAVKFSNDGGEVRVWGKEEIIDNENVIMELGCEDHGIGMSQEFIKHAFDLFAQEKQSSRSHYEGTGLGLAIVKKLVERMGGTIDLRSKQGAGTTVVVHLPFRIGKKIEAVRTETDFEKISVAGMRVLVVEDNELNMEIAKVMLEANSIEVISAIDGQEAFEMFEKSAQGYFDVIFMDIMMPRMNGLDAARAIRSTRRTDSSSIPIIAMSANAFAEDIINSRIAGIDMYLAKPLDEDKMINAIKQCIVAGPNLRLHEDL